MLKYRHAKRLAPILGKHLSEFILEDLSERGIFERIENPIIIPAPMSHKRLQQRGFNQAELLAEIVSERTGFQLIANLLIKTRHTVPQVSLKNKRERLTNLNNAFAINIDGTENNLEPIKKRNIILIDDVYTTGATSREITRILRKSGAKKVLTYTLAH